jgi:hypothetical protein
VRSSPAFAVSSLELPAITAADLITAVLVPLAALFLTWACARAGVAGWVVVAAALMGGWACVHTVLALRRAGCLPVRRLDISSDGTVTLTDQGGQTPRVVTVQPGTRLLGPSVFLDLRTSSPGAKVRLRYWISPFDAPARVLRQWSVVLPRCGRVACT